MKNINYLVIILLFLFTFLMWFVFIPNEVPGKDAAIFPKMIVIWIFINNTILLFQNVKIIKSTENEYSLAYVLNINTLILFSIFIIYIFLLDIFGFFPSSFLFLMITMFSLGIRNYKKLLLINISFLLIVYLVVEKLSFFRLPHGILF